ncbi:Uma2 family endonuclease [Peterkaempfera sp. SMS 1(5)a]|uniref:Uma2 family endonuclease n=1 Tax=Peterkaempfera podocarpi TaxID=3232308 RepID=UPI00366C00A4
MTPTPTLVKEVLPMTALAHDRARDSHDMPGLDEVLWRAWQAMELPEGYRVEIVEGFIEVSPTGRRRHAVLANRLRDALVLHLTGGRFAAYQDTNVIHDRKVFSPDVLIAPRDLEETRDLEGLGVDVSGVVLVAEVVSPGHEDRARDRVRKRRAYARAGIAVYVLVEDSDGHGSVTVLSSPVPEEAVYTTEVRVGYGTDVEVPEGPAKGMVIGESITGS